MPNLHKQYTVSITPTQFLDACDSIELQEVELLIQSARYQNRMSAEEIAHDEYEEVVADEKRKAAERYHNGTVLSLDEMGKDYTFLIPERS